MALLLAVTVIALSLVVLGITFVAMSYLNQAVALLLMVIALSLVVLGIVFVAMYCLNEAVDESGR